jgi:hypothetical protein
MWPALSERLKTPALDDEWQNKHEAKNVWFAGRYFRLLAATYVGEQYKKKSFLCCQSYVFNLPLVAPEMLIKFKGLIGTVRALMRQTSVLDTKLSVRSLPSLTVYCFVCGWRWVIPTFQETVEISNFQNTSYKREILSPLTLTFLNPTDYVMHQQV